MLTGVIVGAFLQKMKITKNQFYQEYYGKAELRADREKFNPDYERREMCGEYWKTRSKHFHCYHDKTGICSPKNPLCESWWKFVDPTWEDLTFGIRVIPRC